MIEVRSPQPHQGVCLTDCMGCGGTKQVPIAPIVSIAREPSNLGTTFALCEECGRDAANVVESYAVWALRRRLRRHPAHDDVVSALVSPPLRGARP